MDGKRGMGKFLYLVCSLTPFLNLRVLFGKKKKIIEAVRGLSVMDLSFSVSIPITPLKL